MNVDAVLSEIHEESDSSIKKLKIKLYHVLCHQSKGFITKKRMVIIDAICNNPDFVDVEDLWVELRENHAISRASVYKVTNVLVKHGILKRKPKNYGYTYHLVLE